MKMKISELIKNLEYSQKEYGDLPVTIHTATIVDGKSSISEDIYFCYEQYEDHDELALRDYPY